MTRPPSPVSELIRLPRAAWEGAGRRVVRDWRAGPVHMASIAGPRPDGLTARARDLRPADAARGEQMLRGELVFAGEGIQLEPGGDPWRRKLPSRRFATALHSFDWANDLAAAGAPGLRELARLWHGWRRIFGGYNPFAWSEATHERRVFNLACAATVLAPIISEAEGAALADDIARQARHLASEPDAPDRIAERAAVMALAGVALSGRAGEQLLERALKRLTPALGEAVLPDGVHASRSPERGLELLFDLMALDEGLSRAGAPSPPAVARAIDRLTAAVRFFTLADGRLAAFHGGEAGPRAEIAAAVGLEREAPAAFMPYGRFHRLGGGALQAVVDTGAPAVGRWADSACAQAGALAVVCEGQRLIEGCGWSARAEVGGALRGPAGGSCLALGFGLPASRIEVRADRHETGREAWLEIIHDGWRAEGFDHARRIYLDDGAGELRGEDMLTPALGARPVAAEVDIRFRLAPGVAVSLALDSRSAVLRPADGGRPWRLRADAEAMRLEPGAAFEDGEPRAAQVIALQALAAPDAGLRVRWKLARDE